MKNHCFVIFIIVTLFFAKNKAEKFICNYDQKFNLTFDEIFFVESPNFPEPSSRCSMDFKVNDAENFTNFKLIFVITNQGTDFDGTLNASTFQYGPYDFFGCSSGFPCVLSVSNSIALTWSTDVAFQGMIIVDTWDFGCPLESATNPNPYKFTDETEIIFMTSTFSNFTEFNSPHTPSNFPCIWHFTAPRMRKFKFVLTNFPHTSASLTITNQDGQIVNITETYKPYYFDDIYITIRFNTTDPKDYFQGYLSIVKMASDLIDGNCSTLINDDGSVFWSTIRENQSLGSYPNNAICTFNLSIPSVNQMVAEFYMLNTETNVDIIHFYMNDMWVDVNEGYDVIYLQAHKNGYNDHVLWEFVSDGSIQQYGFKVNFHEKNCSCAPSNITIPCDDDAQSYNIMGDLMNQYCGNLNCVFNITMDPSCGKKFLNFYFNTQESGKDKENDVASLYLDNTKIINNLLESVVNDIMITKQFPIYLYFVSYPPLNYKVKEFIYAIGAVDLKFTTVILTKANPVFSLNLDTVQPFLLYTVKLDSILQSENDIIEVYCQNFNGIILYEDESLTNILVNGNLYPTVSENNVSFAFNKSITVYGDKGVSFRPFKSVLFFRAAKEHSKNCYLKNNVVYMTKNKSVVSTVSSPNGTCPFVVLFNFVLPGSGRQMILSGIWSSSKNQTCKIRHSSGRIFSEFNNLNTYDRVYINSLFYTFEMPPNSGIDLKSSNVDFTWELNTVPFKILWISPSYDTDTIDKQPTDDQYDIHKSVTAIFTVLELNITSETTVILENVNTTQIVANLTKLGQSFPVTDLSVRLVYSIGPGYMERNRVLISIETIKN